MRHIRLSRFPKSKKGGTFLCRLFFCYVTLSQVLLHRSHITEIFKVYIAIAWLQKNQKFQRTFGCKMTPRFEHSKEACGVLLCGTYQIITDFQNQKKAAHFCAAFFVVMLRFHKFFYVEAIFRFCESVRNFKRHNLVGFDCIRFKPFHV